MGIFYKAMALARWGIYTSIDVLFSTRSEIIPNTVFLLRLDAIGDYVLFRNYIKILKDSNKYKGFRLTVCGNIAWKELALHLDCEYIDEFIWVDLVKYSRNVFYRYNKLREITSVGYEVAINPTYSRTYFFTESILKLVTANEKIGSTADPSAMNKRQIAISNKYYTKLISASSGVLFEFNRNQEYFEKLLEQDIDIKKPTISVDSNLLPKNLPDNYAILFIGSSSVQKKWHIENYVSVAKYIINKYGLSIVLCGAPNDKNNAEIFSKYFDGDYFDYVGKTTLVGLVNVIGGAALMVTNETSAPHLAIAIGTVDVLVIYGGIHYGRFTPYPDSVTNRYKVVCHPEIRDNPNVYLELSNSRDCKNNLDIDEIKVDEVLSRINLIMSGR